MATGTAHARWGTRLKTVLSARPERHRTRDTEASQRARRGRHCDSTRELIGTGRGLPPTPPALSAEETQAGDSTVRRRRKAARLKSSVLGGCTVLGRWISTVLGRRMPLTNHAGPVRLRCKTRVVYHHACVSLRHLPSPSHAPRSRLRMGPGARRCRRGRSLPRPRR
jgi:hypothetical protein